MKRLSDLQRGRHRASVISYASIAGGLRRVLIHVVGVGDILVPDYSAPDWLRKGMAVQLTVEDPARVLVGRAVMNHPPKIRWDPLPC